jgi:DNA invertase Pin-like site-specific DNA recombinase
VPNTAYSYVRFSTADQASGDSIRRQREAALGYAARHGLTLDETYRDPGLTAMLFTLRSR